MIFHVEARCDVGCQRSGNEDMILVGDQCIRDDALSAVIEFDPPGERMVMAVADGMGGAAAGERASEYALTRLAEMMRRAPADLDGDELCELLQIWATRTHAELLEQGRLDAALAGMGTTVVGLLARRGQAWRFHVGDSRLYRYRAAQLEQLTLDHSVRQVTGDAQQPSNLLVNSLGGGRESWLECAPIEGGLQPGDRFLLCSDGLHDVVDAAHIASALAADRETATRTLIQLARDAGGPDNISALVIDLARPRPDHVPLRF
jgi:protein phosphatase